MKYSWQQNVCMLWFSQLLVMAGYDALNPFIPLLLKENMGLTDPAELAFFIAAYNICSFVGYGISNPLWGILGDKYGMKIMLLRGTFLTAIFWPMMGYVHSPWTLSILRFITAFLAGTTAASHMMIARTAPLERQGLAQGILTTAIWGGSMLGNMVGGLVISRASYLHVFWACGIMYFIAGFSILFTYDNGSHSMPPMTMTADAPASSSSIKSRLSSIFALTPAIWLLLGLFVLCNTVRRIELPFVALRVAELAPAGQAAYWTGIISAIVGIGAILSGVVFGYLIDKYPPQKLLPVILLTSALFMLLQGTGHSVCQFTISRALYFFVIGALHTMLQKILTFITPHEKRGLAFGLSTTAGGVGGTISALIGGFILAHFNVSAIFISTAICIAVSYPVVARGLRYIRANSVVTKGWF